MAAASLTRGVVVRHDVPDSAYLSYGGQRQFAGVGQVNAAGQLGGGTLIRHNWVLTAAHMVDGVPIGALSFELNGASYAAAEIIVWPQFDRTTHSGDIALVRLADSVADVAPMELQMSPDEVGRVVSITGMGLTGNGLAGAGNYDGLKRAGENIIDSADGRFLFAMFDAPGANSLPMECGHAPLDGGSGMFIDNNGTWQLAGINSWISDANGNGLTMDYGDELAFARVSSYSDWAYSTIPAPGAIAVLACLGRRRRRES